MYKFYIITKEEGQAFFMRYLDISTRSKGATSFIDDRKKALSFETYEEAKILLKFLEEFVGRTDCEILEEIKEG